MIKQLEVGDLVLCPFYSFETNIKYNKIGIITKIDCSARSLRYQLFSKRRYYWCCENELTLLSK